MSALLHNVGCFDSGLENSDGRGMGLRVAETDQNATCAALCKQQASIIMKNDEWLAGLLPAYLHIMPAELPPDAGTESFGNCLFGRKASREEGPGHSVGETITHLGGKQYALEKSVAELLERSLNPRYFNDIDANAENHKSKSQVPGSRFQVASSGSQGSSKSRIARRLSSATASAARQRFRDRPETRACGLTLETWNLKTGTKIPHRYPTISSSISRTARSMPTRMARLTIL